MTKTSLFSCIIYIFFISCNNNTPIIKQQKPEQPCPQQGVYFDLKADTTVIFDSETDYPILFKKMAKKHALKQNINNGIDNISPINIRLRFKNSEFVFQQYYYITSKIRILNAIRIGHNVSEKRIRQVMNQLSSLGSAPTRSEKFICIENTVNNIELSKILSIIIDEFNLQLSKRSWEIHHTDYCHLHKNQQKYILGELIFKLQFGSFK